MHRMESNRTEENQMTRLEQRHRANLREERNMTTSTIVPTTDEIRDAIHQAYETAPADRDQTRLVQGCQGVPVGDIGSAQWSGWAYDCEGDRVPFVVQHVATKHYQKTTCYQGANEVDLAEYLRVDGLKIAEDVLTPLLTDEELRLVSVAREYIGGQDAIRVGFGADRHDWVWVTDELDGTFMVGYYQHGDDEGSVLDGVSAADLLDTVEQICERRLVTCPHCGEQHAVA